MAKEKNTVKKTTQTLKKQLPKSAKEENTVADKINVNAVETDAAKKNEVSVKKTKKPVKSNAKKSAENNDVFVIQSNGNEYTIDDVKEMCRQAYKNGTRKQIKSLDIYVKYEDSMMRAYYVVNGKTDGLFIEL